MQRNKAFESVEWKSADEAPEGSLRAVFSVFDVPDREGDVVRASAFKDGQRTLMTWAHQWDKPIGDGVIKVEKGRAVFEGSFWMDTIDGEQAYRKVRNAGGLQQYSWGFRVLDTQPNNDIKGYDITKAEIFEVSPVLVGANQYTQTLAVKELKAGDPCPTCGHVKSEPEPESTQPDDQTDEPDWRITAQLALAAAELEELCPL